MAKLAARRKDSSHYHPPRRFPNLPSESEVQDAAVMFCALGDAPRLRLLARLANAEICVSELAELEGEQVTTISARLRALYSARLVKRRRDAKHIFYSLSDDRVLQMIRGAIDHAAERK
jgi:ArsR family transcriptional regulator